MQQPVLNYHAIGHPSSDEFAEWAIEPAAFGEQLDMLVERGLTGVTMAQALASPQSNQIAITFDDGYEDFVTLAMPELIARSFSATLFVATSHVGSTARWLDGEGAGDRPMASWDQLRYAETYGIEIGSHSHTHPQLDLLNASELAADVTTSRDLLQEQLGHEVHGFCYPHGFHGARVKAAVADAGFHYACGVKHKMGVVGQDPFSIAAHRCSPRRHLCTGEPMDRRAGPATRRTHARAHVGCWIQGVSTCSVGASALKPAMSATTTRWIASALLVCSLLATSCGADGWPPQDSQLVFADEFDGNQLDADSWNTCHWWSTDGGCTIASNDELQWYQPDNVVVANGVLRLEARIESTTATDGTPYGFTSGMVSTGPTSSDGEAKFAFTYGAAAARVRIPAGAEFWPAFWLLPASTISRPEIDIMEMHGDQPKALAYILYLNVIALAMRFYRRYSPRKPTMAVHSAMILLIATIVVSHQLTPLVLMVALVGLLMWRRTASVFLPLVVGALTLVLWLASWARSFVGANLSDELSSVGSPVSNAADTLAKAVERSEAQELVALAGRALIVGITLLAMAGMALRIWRGHNYRAPMVLIFAPIVMMVLEFGGEILFRVALFMLPMLSLLAAETLRSLGPRLVQAAASTAVVLVCLVAFSLAYFGKDSFYSFSAAELEVATELMGTAPHNSLLVEASRNYPSQFLEYEKFTYVAIEREGASSQQRILDNPGDVLYGWLSDDERYTASYLILTESQHQSAQQLGLLPENFVTEVEAALRADDRFISGDRE
ncbi:Endo-1,3-1,4-beta-glycanase EglC [Nymphon striatum]|nr:Endo-1,3-1,4-beta-glycanase EglC [Nymphon striatum]